MADEEPPTIDRATAATLLDWYALAGIDAVLLDEPRDRFREGAERVAKPAAPPAPAREPAPEPVSSPAAPNLSRPLVAVPDDVAVADARELARTAGGMDDLRRALEGFTGCNLRLTAKTLVFGDGNPDADLMLVGEAPGREEDLAGVPFVGRSGQLLNRMLAAIGIERDSVWVTNTVPWRPPGNRTPTPAETEICLPFVARQIELVRPKVLVLFGSPATKVLLRTDEGIMRLRGRWLTYSQGIGENDGVAAMPMLHPAYLLRQPAQKKLAWRDLLAVRGKLGA